MEKVLEQEIYKCSLCHKEIEYKNKTKHVTWHKKQNTRNIEKNKLKKVLNQSSDQANDHHVKTKVVSEFPDEGKITQQPYETAAGIVKELLQGKVPYQVALNLAAQAVISANPKLGKAVEFVEKLSQFIKVDNSVIGSKGLRTKDNNKKEVNSKTLSSTKIFRNVRVVKEKNLNKQLDADKIHAKTIIPNQQQIPTSNSSTRTQKKPTNSSNVDRGTAAISEFPVTGIRNLGNSCYFGAALQSIFHTSCIRNYLTSINDCDTSGTCDVCNIKKALKNYEISKTSFNPDTLWRNRIVYGPTFASRGEQDSHELLITILNNISTHSDSNENPFSCIQKSTVKCCECNTSESSYRECDLLSIDIEPSCVSIQNGVNMYQQVTEAERNCTVCKDNKTCNNKLILNSVPDLFVVQVKRFTATTKITNPIEITKVVRVSDEVGEVNNYSLTSIIFHVGNTPNSGHYYCAIYKENENVIVLNDSIVKYSKFSNLNTGEAYCLVYEKKKLPKENDAAEPEPITSTEAEDPNSSRVAQPVTNIEAEDQNSSHVAQPITLTKISRTLDSSQVLAYLDSAKHGKVNEYILSYPPHNPKGGDVFLYKLQSDGDKDYLRDQITGLHLMGKKRLSSNISKYYYKLAEGTLKNRKVIKGFEKHCYLFNEKKDDFVIIHYVGDETLARMRPHGNSRTSKPFVSVTEKSKEKIREELSKNKPPKQVYDTCVREGREEYGDNFENIGNVMVARNTKQVRNIKHRQTTGKRMSKCQLSSIFYMTQTDLADVIRDFRLHTEEYTIISDPAAIKFAKALLNASTFHHRSLPQLLTYDTTFELSDTYVSILVMRNVFCDKNPIFPVMIMLHSSKREKCHAAFWKQANEDLNLELHAPFTPITMDREQALSKTLRAEVPGSILIHCHNHILNDVKFWVKTHGGASDDIIALKKHIQVILDSKSKEEFTSTYEEYRRTWSIPFVTYADSHLRVDLHSSAKFQYDRFPAFSEITPTQNISESYNALIKRKTQGKEMPRDSLLLLLHQLQLEVLTEFSRSCGPSGEYTCKKQFKNTLENISLPKYASISQKSFQSLLKDQVRDAEINSRHNCESATRMEANSCVENGLVGFEPTTKSFVVINRYGNGRNVVHFEHNLHKLVCSCPAGASKHVCYHKQAALNLIGAEIETCPKQARTYELSALQQNKRRGLGEGKAGRKFPRPTAATLHVLPAPDSAASEAVQTQETIEDMTGTLQSKHETELESIRKALTTQKKFQNRRYRNSIKKAASIKSARVTALKNKESIEISADSSEPSSLFSRGRTKMLDKSLKRKQNISTHSSKSITRKPRKMKKSTPKASSPNIITDTTSFEVEQGTVIAEIRKVVRDTFKWSSIFVATTSLFSDATRNRNIHLVSQIAQYGLANYDVILQLIADECSKEYILGGIFLNQKKVFLLDRMNNEENSNANAFKSLIKIGLTSELTAGRRTKATDWKCVLGDDVADFTHISSSAIKCVGHSFNILHDKASKNPLSSKKWVKNFQQQNTIEQEVPVELLTLPFNALHYFEQHIAELKHYTVDPVTDSIRDLVKIEFQGWNKNWDKCAGADCLGLFDQSEVQSMCVTCVRWFHRSCQELQRLRNVKSDYLFCKDCCNGNPLPTNILEEDDTVKCDFAFYATDAGKRFKNSRSKGMEDIKAGFKAIEPTLTDIYKQHVRTQKQFKTTQWLFFTINCPFSEEQRQTINSCMNEWKHNSGVGDAETFGMFKVTTANFAVFPLLHGQFNSVEYEDSVKDFAAMGKARESMETRMVTTMAKLRKKLP